MALDILKNERVKFRVKSAAGWAHRDPPTKGYMIYRIWSLNSVTHVYPSLLLFGLLLLRLVVLLAMLLAMEFLLLALGL